MTDISLQKTAKTPKRPRGRPFPKGQSGNPAGRPRGSTNRATRAAELLLDGEAAALSRKAVEMALAGDAAALRLCLDRTVAPRRERSVELPLPAINSAADILGAIKAVAGAVGRGAITPGEGFALSQMIESFLRAIDASDFDNRLRQLEEAQVASRPDSYGPTVRYGCPPDRAPDGSRGPANTETAVSFAGSDREQPIPRNTARMRSREALAVAINSRRR